MRLSEVKCREKGKNEALWETFKWVVKLWEVKAWGETVSKIVWEKNTRNYIEYFLLWCCLPFNMLYFKMSCVYFC